MLRRQQLIQVSKLIVMMARIIFVTVVILTQLNVNIAMADRDQLTEERKTQIKHIVLHDCGSCHGMTLKGGLGPSITAESVQMKPDGYLFNTIRDGLEGTPMPPWLGIFTELEIRYLVELLKQGKVDS